MDWIKDLFGQITEWAKQHEAAMFWIVAVSATLSLGGMLLVPWVIVRIPADYFSHKEPPRWGFTGRHPVLRVILIVLKNVLGIILLVAGIAMSVAPGPGMLALILAMMMLDLPGKRRLERWAVTRPGVMRALNALRSKAGAPPLEKPQEA